MTSWEEWADGVLLQLGAPLSQTNLDTLWAWSNKESGADVMRWNNPLNTTERWGASVSMNSVGVQAYATITDGINATVVTIENGHYPTILAHLQGSTPRASWTDACAELGTWGTGCGWLQSTYGPAPGNLGVDVTPEQDTLLHTIASAVTGGYYVGPNGTDLDTQLHTEIKAIKADTTAIKAEPSVGGTVDLAPVLNAIAALRGELDVVSGDLATVKRLIEKDLAP